MDTKYLRSGIEPAGCLSHNLRRFDFAAALAFTDVGQRRTVGGGPVRVLVGSGARNQVVGFIIRSYLGSSGLLVSRITLGTMTFGTADWRSIHPIGRRLK